MAVAAVVLVAGGAAVAYLLPRGGCENEIIGRFPSPDGKFEAVTFLRACGASTGSSTQLSVVRMGEALPDGPGNVAAVDSSGGKAPSGPRGGPELRVSWWGNELRVWHHRQARLSKRDKPDPLGVPVRFQAFD